MALNVAPAFAGATTSGYDETGVLGDVPTNTGKPTVLGASAVRPQSGAGAESTTAPAVADVTPAESIGSTGGSSLPFTGMDLGIVALLGLALVGTGFAVRRGVSRGHAA